MSKQMSEEQIYEQAKERVEAKKGFFIHFAVYIVVNILLLLKLKERKEPLPFGSFLAIATMLTLVWGSAILNWYLGLLRF